VDPVGTGGQVWLGEDGLAADGADSDHDLLLAAGNHDTPEIGLHGASPDLDNHRFATNIRQRFIG
jgi:hypothetical protein